ncbi:MAG: hypothetical protein IT352_03165, partial [Gemmatimonadales bacterium]|nr:hypothetical protein [Gemmatimonadales bacterium]
RRVAPDRQLALSRLEPGVDGEFFYSPLRNASVDSRYDDDDGAILTAYPGGDNRAHPRGLLWGADRGGVNPVR